MYSLGNKIIIVTGGSGLLGVEIINEISSKGGIALNADVNVETDLDNRSVNCDVTSAVSIRNMVELVMKRYGKIDGLVNNAYPRTVDWGNKFEDVKFESWKINVDMQLNSIFILSQMVLSIMKSQNFGSIVNIASIYGNLGPDFTIYNNTNMTMPAAYSAIKGGVINFTKYLASYFGKYNIRINCVSPGGIYNNQLSTFVNNYIEKVPMRRMGTPKDIAPSVSFLLSDNSSYITGHNLIIDGGWSAI
jgi:NAD(P)-dependent dehydrogenase (short-subunit alcohol dehydrogenase family)